MSASGTTGEGRAASRGGATGRGARAQDVNGGRRGRPEGPPRRPPLQDSSRRDRAAGQQPQPKPLLARTPPQSGCESAPLRR
jgi:hypothetical protein